MARISLAGFKDPVRRPRYIIWTGVIVLLLAAFIVVALGITSTRWFCANACHKVQDDTIIAYEHSSHSVISCMACHMPVNANPIIFVLHKAEALGEAYLTIANKFELPLNAESEVSQEMESERCTQCHSSNREVTPSPGIIINHEIHKKKGVACAKCHNRIAHKEDFTLVLKGNHKHEDFMKMEGCFRCHGLEEGSKAPGACSVCHTRDFELKPENHLEPGFFPKGHAELKKEEPKYCRMCHVEKKFCMDCHGMEMPHPEEFKTKTHPETVKTQFKKCDYCHKVSKTFFCSKCHHKGFAETVPWARQHAKTVASDGVAPCLGACHAAKFCSDCHTKTKPFPTSHKAKDWLHRAKLDARAAHAEGAKKEITACEICHGTGGAKSRFCMACHKIEMPHPASFKSFHAGTGRKAPRVCANCHRFRELCSNCHHKGASNRVPWLRVHPKTVASDSAAGCFEKCHKDKNFCVTCHTRLKALPTSHRARDWTRRTNVNVAAKHPKSFEQSAESCTYCHGDGGPKSRFCMACHKLEMPHAADFKDTHKAQFEARRLAKRTCTNCHIQFFCDKCHHVGSVQTVTWLRRHQVIVKQNGADPCFKCHAPTACSYCHVRLLR
ncbi:MAG: NapC/NirT family cytochrome c [Coriobacteriia bacterium]